MLQLLADEQLPQNMFDVLLGPLLAALAGLGVFYLTVWLASRGRGNERARWVALVPLAIGLYLGGAVLYKWLTNPIYTDMVAAGAAKKMTAAHWAAFLVPLLCFLAVVLYPLYRDRVNLVSDE